MTVSAKMDPNLLFAECSGVDSVTVSAKIGTNLLSAGFYAPNPVKI